MYNLLNSNVWQEVIKKVYGFNYINFLGKDNSLIKFTHIYKPLIKNHLINSPYITNSNPIIYTNEGFFEIIEEIEKFYKKNNIKLLEIRSSKPLKLDWAVYDKFVTFRISLKNGIDYVFNKLHTKVRTSIRRGQKNNLLSKTGKIYIKEFYKIYSQSVKRLGTPVHSFPFFNELLHSSEKFNIIVIYTKENVPVSSVLWGEDKNTLYPLIGGGLIEYNNLSHDSFMYWELIKYACKNNLLYFDFGRSKKNSGTYYFKKRWYADEVQLYYYYLSQGKKIIFENEKKNKIITYIWSKLPLKTTQLIGSKIRKYIP